MRHPNEIVRGCQREDDDQNEALPESELCIGSEGKYTASRSGKPLAPRGQGAKSWRLRSLIVRLTTVGWPSG